MTESKAYAIISIVFAFAGTCFFVAAFYKMTPEIICNLSRDNWIDVDVNHIIKLCDEKSHILTGFFLMFVSSISQLISIFKSQTKKIKGAQAYIGVALVLAILALSYFADKGYSEKCVKAATNSCSEPIVVK